MFRRNVADQAISFEMINATTGGDVTAGVTVQVARDHNTAYAAGQGVLTHMGGAAWRYTFTQAETDANVIHLSASASGAVSTTRCILTTAANTQNAASFGLTNLDSAVGTRLAAAGYTAPDNTGIAAIRAKTDNLPGDPASNTQVNTRLATTEYTAPDNTGISAIRARTDNLPNDPASNTQVNTRLATTGYTAPDNTGIASILNRLGAFTGSGVNTVLGFFQSLFRSNASTPSDIGGTFNPATDSVEAIRDRGDAAWVTGSGGGGGGGGFTTQDRETLESMRSRLSASVIQHAPPVRQDGSVEITQGDTYTMIDGRELRWLVPSPDLTGGTVAFGLDLVSGVFVKAGSIVNAGTPWQAVVVELTETETNTFGHGVYRFDVQATILTRRVTIVSKKTATVNRQVVP